MRRANGKAAGVPRLIRMSVMGACTSCIDLPEPGLYSFKGEVKQAVKTTS